MNDARDGARRQVTIVNRRGLHARAAGRIAKVASEFDANVTVATSLHEVSALSIMGLLMMAASKGMRIEIRASGADAEAAVEAVAALVENRFGEEDPPEA